MNGGMYGQIPGTGVEQDQAETETMYEREDAAWNRERFIEWEPEQREQTETLGTAPRE